MEVKDAALTEFQSTKLLFLKNSEYSKNTKTTYWGLYTRFISDLEIKFDKDLFKFSQKEIDCYKEIIKKKSEQTIYQTNAFVNRYLIWYSNFYNKHPKSFNLNIIREKDNFLYINKENFFKIFNNMLENNISILNLVPILLARYGILGKEAIYIRNAKWKDISFRNREFLIYNKDRTEVISTIPIDENFIEVMISIWKYEKQLYKGKKIRNKHIVKSQIIEEEMVNYNSLNSKVFRCFKDVNMKRISLKILFNCAVIDYINKIYSKTIPRSNEELMKLLSIYYPDEKLTLEKLRVIKKLYGEAFDDTETLRTYGRVRNKNFSNNTRVFNRNNTRYTSEENYDFQLNKSKDTLKNEIIIEENYAYIILEGIIVEIKKVKINREIVDKVKDYKWHLNSSGNVITRKKIEGRLSIIHLSNLILNKEEYYRIKYINNDKLDCTIENLEVNGLY